MIATAELRETAGASPYRDGLALLADLFVELDERLKLLVLGGASERAAAADPMLHGLVITDADVRTILEDGGEAWVGKFKAGSLWNLAESRLEATRREGIPLPLALVRERFGLSAFETECLAICAAPELDPKYEKLFGYLNDDVTRKHPTAHLLLRLLCSAEETPLRYRRYLLPGAPLFRAGLLAFVDEATASNPASQLNRCVRVEPGVVQFLLEERQLDPDVESYWAESPYPSSARWLWESERAGAALDEIVRGHLEGSGAQRERLVCILSGRDGSGRRHAAETTCQRLGLSTISLDCRRILRHPLPGALLAKAFRDSALHTAPLVLTNFEAFLEDRERSGDFRLTLQRLLDEHGWVVFVCVPEKAQVWRWFAKQRTVEVEFPELSVERRCDLWERALASVKAPAEESGELASSLASKFRLTAGGIALAAAKAACLNQGRAPGESWRNSLHRAASEACAPHLGELAQEIKPIYSWDQLVLPAAKADLVRDVIRHVHYRRTVLEDWEFGKRMSRGKGLNVLFAGPSGTGKTMTAEVIAKELSLALYRIDLAGVVSKYIGDTERNLSRIFREAEHSDAILFFDEADALFGKRSEVRDAHDRYANIEINYLLQLIENHEGVTILATNLRHHLDDAFLRRIQVVVEFPEPAAEERLRIWRQALPEKIVAEDADLGFLAKTFEFNGGSIASVAMTAAFLAAENSKQIEMRHLVRAVQRELEKSGKRAIRDEFGPYSKLLA